MKKMDIGGWTVDGTKGGGMVWELTWTSESINPDETGRNKHTLGMGDSTSRS